MSILKQLDRAASTCWSPKHPHLIASGTIAGTIDDSFITKSQLEIYDIDLQGQSNTFKLLGSIESKDCFHSVAWGSKGTEDGSSQYGLVAGGMSDGSINIWTVDGILNRAPIESVLLARTEVHKGQVLGLQFHPSQPNLLASGATDGEVFIWDLANVKAPVPNKPNPQLKTNQPSGITSLAWNKQAPQILASASEVGETTVWDLRQKRSIITIRNSARMNVRASGLAWNPAAGVQLAVCYSNYPVAEIWDLRQSMTPKVKLEGFHNGSILSLDWCPNDPSILVTVGEDARMASWNPLTGAFLSEYQTSNVAFDIQWSPKQPNLLSTSSYDGKVNILSINSTGPSHVPSWMTRPIGASFGFGGKLVTFGFDAPPPSATPPPTGGPASPHKPINPKVQLQQLVTDPEVLEKAQGFQQILKEGDFPKFCAYKIAHSEGDEEEKCIWTFMKILFEEGTSQRYLLLKELGFTPPPTSDIVIPQPTVPVVPDISEDDFFNQDFASPKPADGDATGLDNTSALSSALDGISEGKESESNGVSSAPSVPVPRSANEEADDRAIRQALVFGDFRAAVTKCLAVGRMADAIIFASFGPPGLWEETRATYFESHRMPFIRNVMKNVSKQSLDEMVQESTLDNWRETLAICITYTNAEQFRKLVNQLGQRLEDAGKNIPAVICYICSSNVDKAIEMWTTKIPVHVSSGSGGSALLALHYAIEKIAVLAHGTNATQQPPSKTLSLKYAEYANMLASQGELRGAFNYLSRVATPNDPNSSVLLDRIFHAESEQFLREQYPMPPFPFPVERVDLDPTLQQTLQAQAIAKQQRQQMIQQQAAIQAQSRGQNFQQTHQQTNQRQPQPAYNQNQPPQPNGYGQPTQPYGQPNQPHYNQHYSNQPPQPTQPTGYGAPNPSGPYGANPNPNIGGPAPNQPRTFQPQPPNYGGQPQPTQPPQPTYQPTQPNYGNQPQPPSMQPYGQPQPPVARPPVQPQPQPTNYPPQPQPSTFNPAPAQTHPSPYGNQPPVQPIQPAYNQPPTQPAVQPITPFVPPTSPYVPSAAAPVPAPTQPKPFVPTQPTSSPMATTPVAATPTATEAPVVLSPADQSLIQPLENCLTALLAVGLKPPEQKKVLEIRTKIQELAKKLSSHELSATAMTELQLLSQSVGANDFTSAQKHHLNLVKTDWANNNEWLLGLKTMLLMAKKYLEKSG